MNDQERLQAVRQAWETGQLRYKLSKIQREISAEWAEKTKANGPILLHIGRQTGKSFLLNVRVIEECLRVPNTICVYVAPVERKLAAFIRGLLQTILEDCPEDLAPEWKQQKNQLVFANGSIIHYFGSTNDNHNAIRGIGRVTLVVLDEAGFFANLTELISVVAPMLLRSRGKLVYSSSSPETPDHPFVSLIEQAKLEGWYIFHPTWDNKEIDPIALDELAKLLGGKDSTKWRREVGCELIVERTKQVLPEWDSHLYVKKLVRPATYKFFHHFVSYDPGFRDPSSVTFGTYFFGHGVLYIEDEIVIPGKDITIDKFAAKVQAKVLELWPGSERVHYWADPSNQTILDELGSRYKLYFNWTAKDKKKQSLETFRAFIGQGGLILDPKCTIHATMFSNTIWNAQRTDFERSASGFHGDCVDSALYMFRNLVLENPVPPLFSVDPENDFVRMPKALQEQSELKNWIGQGYDDNQQFDRDAKYED